MSLPTFYLSHGSPSDALEFGAVEQERKDALTHYAKPKSILVMSPHWMSDSLRLTASQKPETLHDFSGFSDDVFALQYPAKGDLELAIYAQSLLTFAGLNAELDTSRGLDHGVWAPLMPLYPNADVPIVALSMPKKCSAQTAYKIGRALESLRHNGVLIIGSGSTTHNLQDVGQPAQPKYVDTFTQWLQTRINRQELATLLDYRSRAPHAQRAHPTDEHLMPLFFAIGAAGEDWTSFTSINSHVRHSALAMNSWLFATNH